MRQGIASDLPVASLFETPTVAALVAKLTQRHPRPSPILATQSTLSALSQDSDRSSEREEIEL